MEARAKDPSSLGKKASLPSEDDPRKPKYPHPLQQITDLVGIRIIAYFPGTLDEIDEVIRQELTITERADKGGQFLKDERFGYQSIHYLVSLSAGRATLPEYSEYADTIAEIQVRTILQHAWAEIEHDIQYKSALAIPRETHRRFMPLAGLLEIADREFQAIQESDHQIRESARTRVESGHLEEVEITPDDLKAFLDKKLGEDGRISEWSYDWTVGLLKKLGFKTLEQVDRCIDGYDDDKLSRIAEGARQGQTSRFEHMLLAGMGSNYIERHPWSTETWFGGRMKTWLEKYKKAGIPLRVYDPSNESNDSSDRG